MKRLSIRETIYLAFIAVLMLYAHDREYQVQVAPHVQAEAPLRDPRCKPRDYLGRQLVSSYYARSDRIQTLRCNYAKRIWT